jgi:outer membrane immunogenic protein
MIIAKSRVFDVFDGSVAMRRLVLTVVMLGAVSGAQAADWSDLPILRGTQGLTTARTTWQGYYVGGQASYGLANMNFAHANDGIAEGLMPYSPVKSLTGLPVLGKSSNPNTGFGGFVGYNGQWEDVVVGLEANYIHGKFDGASNPRAFRYTDAFGNPAIAGSSTASVSGNDYGSLRVRGGYAIGAFLPYLFGGIAMGRADIDRSVSLLGNFNPLVTANSSLKDHFLYGYSMGVGVDMMLCAGLFMRLEYEYQRFASPVDINLNTVRAGLGYKF